MTSGFRKDKKMPEVHSKMLNPKISIIIPFFQKDRGILEKAVLSILRQKNVDNFEIIVVDDGSFVPAHEELRDLLKTHQRLIRIISQKNKGINIARNVGLDAVSEETEFVAFLDSDDEWSDSHLENAIIALNKGYDLYFSDYFPVGEKSPKFHLCKKFRPEDHKLIDKERKIYEFSGDFFDSLLQKNFVGSTVIVYRYKKYPFLRFHKDIARSVTRLFVLNLARLSKGVVFSARIECCCGKGVNIYQSVTRDSQEHLIILYNQLKAWKYALRTFSLTREQNRIVKAQIQKIRSSFMGGGALSARAR